MNIKVGILTSRLETDNPGILEALHKLYSFPVLGYQYTPAFKNRRWDGKKSYFSKQGVFRSGLLQRILADLNKIEAKYEVEYVYPNFEDIYISHITKLKYYDYQEKAIEYILNFGRGLIIAPTGSGKTLILAGIIKSLQPNKMAVLFREKGILNQTYKFLTEACKLKNIGINSGEGYIYGDVMLSTVQSIEKILDTHLHDAKVLMVDEVHQFGKGDVTIAAIQAFPNATYRVGFTATLPSEKEDIHARMILEGSFGPPIETKSTSELIEDGKLTKPIIQIITNNYPKIPNMPYLEVYDTYIVNNLDRNTKIKNIVDFIRKTKLSSKILILTKNLEHVQNLQNLIDGCYTIEGKDSLSERYDIISSFRDMHRSTVLIGTNVIQTGINIEEITHLINARGLKGEIPTIQGIGRALRKSDNKEVVYIYDFYDDIKYLKEHSKSRIMHYEDQGHEIEYI
jgi:superfamily II DNA or RNA helicase